MWSVAIYFSDCVCLSLYAFIILHKGKFFKKKHWIVSLFKMVNYSHVQIRKNFQLKQLSKCLEILFNYTFI